VREEERKAEGRGDEGREGNRGKRAVPLRTKFLDILVFISPPC